MSAKAPPPVVLLWGEDTFLLRDRALALFGDIQPAEVDGGDWQGGETADLATPSLFGERRGLLVTDAKSLPSAALDELERYAAAPSPDALLVLTAKVGERTKSPPAALGKLTDAVERVAVDRKDLPRWIKERAEAAGGEVTPAAAQALVAIVGEEPAELLRSIEQVIDAYPGQRITPEIVARQFRGLGDLKSWDLCDRAFSRDLPGAVHALGSIRDARGGEPLMILGAIAARTRDLIKVRSLPDRASPAEVAKAAGLGQEWRGRRYAEQARRYTLDELVSIQGRVMDADRALKSGADGDVVLTVLVSQIAG